MEKPSFDSVIALWNELNPAEKKALVNSDNRPAIKEFLKNPGKVVAIVIATFKSLLDACHQDGYRSSDFTEDRFPLEPVATDEADWEVVEHYLTKTGTLDDGLKQLKKLEAKGEIKLLTGSRRAMEYIAAHPEAQLDHPIILPLRARDSGGDCCLPVFSRRWGGGRRSLFLCRTGSTFGSLCSWLVLRPKSSDGASKRQK